MLDKWIGALIGMRFVEGHGFSRAAQRLEKMGR